MLKLKLFLVALAVGFSATLSFLYWHRLHEIHPALKPVAAHLFVTSQLQPESVEYLRRNAIVNIVDLRPDGETNDQASSQEIKAAADKLALRFHYLPVPHGAIPSQAVHGLSSILDHDAGSTVLYCRSGNRAVRTLALVQASRPAGPDAPSILQMVKKAGFTADDLRGEIDQRIAQRSAPRSEPMHP